jgi:CHAT domain-containing protein
MAGAHTVISSLWSIPDQETVAFMDHFYANLWDVGMGKHAALRAAQLEMIDQDVSPEHWGAFVLDGDWR